jgi:hypothetical protein
MVQVTPDTDLESMMPPSMAESLSAGLQWGDGDTEGPELLPSIQVLRLSLMPN